MIMDSTTTFSISFDRPSRIPMTVLGAGPKVSRVMVSPSTVDIRLGWAFHATIPREDVASARSLGRGELRGPFRLSVLRGVNYWWGTALVNGAGTGLVEIMLNRPKLVRLGPFPVPMRRLVVSAEDQSGPAGELVADDGGLALPVRAGEEDPRLGAWRADHYPPLGTAVVGQRRRVLH
jgi:hypothetical protein